MSFINNMRVAYKLLILCVIGAIGMAILGYSGYSALQTATREYYLRGEAEIRLLYRQLPPCHAIYARHDAHRHGYKRSCARSECDGEI